MIPLARSVSSRQAEKILHNVFADVPGCAFRLWDGTLVTMGSAPPVCTAVVHRSETFLRLIRDPSPLNFAEAYVEGAIDLDGDLFAAMRIADSIEEIRLSTVDRLRILLALWWG